MKLASLAIGYSQYDSITQEELWNRVSQLIQENTTIPDTPVDIPSLSEPDTEQTNTEIDTMEPTRTDYVDKQYNIKLLDSISGKTIGTGPLKPTSIKKGYKRIQVNGLMLVETRPHYKQPGGGRSTWNPPRATDWKQDANTYKYFGDNKKWNTFISNGELIKTEKYICKLVPIK